MALTCVWGGGAEDDESPFPSSSQVPHVSAPSNFVPKRRGVVVAAGNQDLVARRRLGGVVGCVPRGQLFRCFPLPVPFSFPLLSLLPLRLHVGQSSL